MSSNAMYFQRFQMEGGTVANIGLPSIMWKLLRHPDHEPVAIMLGNDRSGGNREAAAVSLDDGLHDAGQLRGLVAINKRNSRADFKCIKSLLHRQQRGLQYIDFIDLGHAALR